MNGTIKKLKDSLGNYIFPVTASTGVYMEDGTTSLKIVLDTINGNIINNTNAIALKGDITVTDGINAQNVFLSNKIGSLLDNSITENSVALAIKNDRTNIANNVSQLANNATDITNSKKQNSQNVINAKEYGAMLDGVTDDTTSLLASITHMADGLEYFIPKDTVISKVLLFQNLKNITFTSKGLIKIASNFDATSNAFIKFVNCTNVYFQGRLDAQNNTFYPNNGNMNFPILFTDCKNVVVDNTEVSNCALIGGFSSSINAVNSGSANAGFHVKKLLVNNCRSAVFTQYSNNTIENVRAYDTTDAVIALNSENCLHTYINNCFADRNVAFPLIAIENTATDIVIENCVAKNTRGLVEIFILDTTFTNALPQRLEQIIIRNCKHILDNNTYVYTVGSPIQTFSFRGGIEKHAYIKIENVEQISTIDKTVSYLYISSTELLGDKVQSLQIINPVVVAKTISDYVMLLNANVANVRIINPYLKCTGTQAGFGIRITRDAMKMTKFKIEDGTIDNFVQAMSNDILANRDNLFDLFSIKNVRAPNCGNLFFQSPLSTIGLSSYQLAMINSNEYILTNTGNSRFTINSANPPTSGIWKVGDIAINTFNSREYFYNGTAWVFRAFLNQYYTIGSGAPVAIPAFVGQQYYDTTNKKKYEAFGFASTGDWVIMN